MKFYLINLVVLIVYSTIIQLLNIKNERKVLLFTYVLHFSLIAGLRAHSVGTDTQLYNNIFLTTANSNFAELLNNSKFIGYSFLMKIISIFTGNNYTVFLLFVSFLTNFFIFFVAYKIRETSLFFTAFFYSVFYYFYQSMNISRQYLAIALCIYFFYLVAVEKKFIKGLVVLLIATSIHTTAIVCLIFIPLSRIKWDLKKYLYLSFLSVICSLLYKRGVIFFTNIFDDYQMYSENQYLAAGNRIFLVMFLLLIVLLGLFLTNRYKEIYSDNVFILQSFLLVSIIFGLFYSRDQLVVRIQTYYEIFSVMYIPLLFFPRPSKSSLFRPISFFILAIALVSLVPFYYQLSGNYGNIIPYTYSFRK